MPARPVWAVPKIAGQKVSQNGKKCLLLFRSCIVKYLCHTTTPSLRTRQHTWCMRVHRSVFGHDVPPHDARRRTLLAQARTPLSPRLVRIASSLLASRPPSGCGHARSQRQPAHRLTELRGAALSQCEWSSLASQLSCVFGQNLSFGLLDFTL